MFIERYIRYIRREAVSKTIGTLVLTIILTLTGTAIVTACSVQLDPRIEFVEWPQVVYEDEEYTWKVALYDFALPGNTNTLNLLQPPANIRGTLLDKNFKNFPFDMGGEVTGAIYDFSIRNGGRDPEGNRSAYVTERLRGGVDKWQDLPGRFPESSGVPLQVDGLKIIGDVDDSECAVSYKLIDGNLLESVEVMREEYIDPTQWDVTTVGVSWNMDAGNLGYNGEEELIEANILNYESYQRGDSATVWGGSGETVQNFTYTTPSDPEAYNVVVSIGTEMTMVATWRWFEIKRTRRYVRTTDPASGEEVIAVIPVDAIQAVNELFELYLRTENILQDGNPNAGERQSVISDHRDQIDEFIMGHVSVVTKVGIVDQYEIQNLIDQCVDEFVASGQIQSDAIEYMHGPFIVDIAGSAIKETGGSNSSVRPGELDVMVMDKTPPLFFHLENSQVLNCTTGDLVSEWNDKRERYGYDLPENPASVTVRIIENNPCMKTLDKPFNAGVYYVTQLSDYQHIEGKFCGKTGYDHPETCDCFPVYREKFVWVKLDEIDHTNPNITVEKYDYTGQPVDGDTGQGGETDPAYCVLTWNIPLEKFKEPMSTHFATTSRRYTDPWGHEHPGWDNGGRLKIMVHMVDSAGLEMPGGWLGFDGIKYQPPDYDGWETNQTNLEHPVAAHDLLPPYLAVNQYGQIARIDQALRDMPDFTVPDFFLEDGLFDPNYWGRCGIINVYDDDRPTVRLNISDRSFLRRTFSFGNIWMGDYKREAFQKARKNRSRVYTLSNQDTVQRVGGVSQRPYVKYLDGDAIEDRYGDPERLEFKYGDTKRGYIKQGTMIANNQFTPWFYGLYNNPYADDYGLFVPPDDRLYGYWVPEDLRLSFDLIMVPDHILACDNINTYMTEGQNPGGISTYIDPATGRYETFVLKDGIDKYPGVTSYNFRDKNRGPGARRRDCSVFVRVEDSAPAEIRGPFAREVEVYFYVAGTDIKTYTIKKDQKLKKK